MNTKPSHTPSEESPALFNRGQVTSKEQRRELILADAKERIPNGDSLADIAADHGITSRTLHTYLSALGDEYQELRKAWIDNMLADAFDRQGKAAESIDTADEQFQLARAREQLKASESIFRSAAWIAERRDRARYGQQPAAHAGGDVHVTIQIGSVTPAGVTIEGGVVDASE